MIPIHERIKPTLKTIFLIANGLPQIYQFSIGEQLRRSSLSIGLNIAESNGRRSTKEKQQFLNIALGSLKETVYLLEFIHTMDIKTSHDLRETRDKLEEYARILYSILNRS
jgi:four helix bundle protein